MGYADPKKQRAYQNEWLKRKRQGPRGDEVREAARRCRARQLGAPGSGLPPGWEQAQLAKQQGRCAWCGADITGTVRERHRTRVAYDADHVTPLEEGGAHTEDNVVLACRDCNGKRGGETGGAGRAAEVEF